MGAPGSDDRPRLRVTGIGSAVELAVGGAGAAELLVSLTRAWSRCLSPAGAGGNAEGDAVTADLVVVLDHAGTDADAESDALPTDLAVVLDPAAAPAVAEGHAVPTDLAVVLDHATAPACDDDRVSGSALDTVMVRTTQAITRRLIGTQAGRLLMLHAGAVANPESGRTVVLVAPGGTGKTTLVRTLAARYGYLTDETVAIDADFRVLPYPKPLSVRRAGAPKQELSPDDLGLVAAPAEATVVRLCLLDRDDRHPGAPEVTELALLDAITELTPQTSSLYALPEGLRTLARLIEATGPVLRLRYAEAEDLIPLVDELLGEPNRPGSVGDPRFRGDDGADEPPTPPRHPGLDPGSLPDETPTQPRHPELDPGSLPASHAEDPALRVHANPFADTLEREGEALVLLRDGGLLRLNPLGASIVEFAVNPIRLDDLASALARRFGAPEGVDLLGATAERVTELAAQGVLTVGEPPLPDSPGPYWRVDDDTAFTVSAPDRVVVFNLATPTEQPQALVGTAAAIWQFLIGDDPDSRPWTSEPDLIADLAEAYATDPAAIVSDVQEFLARMQASGHLNSRPAVGT